MVTITNKSLGQHWLRDRTVLHAIAHEAELTKRDTVLEIGPGLGTLTSVILRLTGQVIAIEFDTELAAKLPAQFPGTKLTVRNQDILLFDLETLPRDYKVVANVPYYITSKIIHRLMTASNKPSIAVLLVQKEVAERIAAGTGKLSILAISAQVYAEVTLGDVVPAALFEPAPKVDSQVVILRRRSDNFFADINEKDFFRVIKAGFSAKRKKVFRSIAAGLGLSIDAAKMVLKTSDIDPNLRAQDVTIEQWKGLTQQIYDNK